MLDRQTYTNLKRWIDDVRNERGNDVIVVIVGNKIDLDMKRCIISMLFYDNLREERFLRMKGTP